MRPLTTAMPGQRKASELFKRSCALYSHNDPDCEGKRGRAGAASGLHTELHRSSCRPVEAETCGFWVAVGYSRRSQGLLLFLACYRHSPSSRGEVRRPSRSSRRVREPRSTMKTRAPHQKRLLIDFERCSARFRNCAALHMVWPRWTMRVMDVSGTSSSSTRTPATTSWSYHLSGYPVRLKL